MRRGIGFAFVVVCAARASAQTAPSVVAELQHRGETPQVAVRLRNLLDDERFLRAMRSGFPLYLEYRVELRGERSNWFDRGVQSTFWDYVVLYDPVREVFVKEDEDGREELGGEAALRRALETVFVFEVAADRPGRFYYDAAVSARTLSDADVDEVFDWLRGDDAPGEERPRSLVTRGARRLLVQVAPLPRLTLTDRSPTFRWPEPDLVAGRHRQG